ncbi:MAG: YfhO family protein, partial [Lachnospiraceae bacterium]|nr:YfhO family protein [Lachnospiraceae bacterium]
LLACISAPDMLYNAKVSYIKMNADDGVLPSMSKFRDDYHRVDEAVSYIKSKDGGFYRIEKDFDRTVNDPAMFDYIGLSHDSSCEKDAINHYLTNYGFRETIYYTFYNGGSTSFADAVLGVKYFIAGQGDTEKPYDYMGEEGGYGIYENAYALPMAYIAPDKMTDFTFDEENTFEKQNHLAAVWETGTNDGANPLYIRAESGYRLDGAEEDAPGHFVRTDDEGFIVYNVHITEDNMPLYLYFSAPAMQSGEVFVNGDSLGWYFTENHWNVLNAGTFSKGEDVEIRMQILKDELTISEACFYYEDSDALETWSGRAGNQNDRIGAVSEIASSHLKFDTDTENGEMVVISIPYDTAWKVYCDGKRIESVPAVEMLMGLKLPRGHHEIEMKYIPHGTIPGFIVSLAGVVLFVGAVVRQRIGEGDS